MEFANEARLLWAIGLNTAVAVGAYRFARSRTADPLQRFSDTLLIWFLLQYASVTLPGAIHLLSPLAITITALVQSAALAFLSLRSHSSDPVSPDSRGALSPSVILVGVLFVCGCLAVSVWAMALVPVSGTDALTYHVPAAVQWLADGRISLFQTWFFNPANT